MVAPVGAWILPAALLVADAPERVSRPPSLRRTPELLMVLLIRPLPLMVPVLVIEPPLRLELAPWRTMVPEEEKELMTERVAKSAMRNSPPAVLPERLLITSGLEELATIRPPALLTGA